VNVHWTETATEHLVAIYEHIARDSERYAQRMIDRITQHSRRIADYPESGRMVPEYEAPDVREVIERPYRIIYRILKDRIDIVAVVHAARDLHSDH
jgi:addiction module RelE/StbE family toxin